MWPLGLKPKNPLVCRTKAIMFCLRRRKQNIRPRSLSIKLEQKVVHVSGCGFICEEVEPDETKTRLKRKQPGLGLDDGHTDGSLTLAFLFAMRRRRIYMVFAIYKF